MSTQKIPAAWAKWCSSGKHGVGGRKKKAVLKYLQSGHVRGYFSDIPLRPDLEGSHSMYPSFEHLVDPTNHQAAVVEARIFNDMKSHLSEAEFWQAIEHLFIVGVQKGKITPPFGKRLPKGWSPAKHYTPKAANTKHPTIQWHDSSEYSGEWGNFGHGVHFHDKKQVNGKDLVAFIEGFDWLHNQSAVVRGYHTTPNTITTPSALAEMKRLIEKMVISQKVVGDGFLSPRLYALANA
jgi:hypothetical protein